MWDYEVLSDFRATGSGGQIQAGCRINIDPSMLPPGCHCCEYVLIEDPARGINWPDQVERSLLASHCRALRTISGPAPQCTDLEAAQDFFAQACGQQSVHILAKSRITIDLTRTSGCPCCVPVTITEPPRSKNAYGVWPSDLPRKVLHLMSGFVQPWGLGQPGPNPTPTCPHGYGTSCPICAQNAAGPTLGSVAAKRKGYSVLSGSSSVPDPNPAGDLRDAVDAWYQLRAAASPPSHDGHQVVENTALGKPFKYCRDCKVEV